MTGRQEEIWDALLELTAEQVVLAFVQYNGTQILDAGFYKHLVDEGIISTSEEE